MRRVRRNHTPCSMATINPPHLQDKEKRCRRKKARSGPIKRNRNQQSQKPRCRVFRAVLLRSFAVHDAVRVKKIGIPPKGSTMGNSARKVAAGRVRAALRRNCPRTCVAFIELSITFQSLRSAFERCRQDCQLLAGPVGVSLIQSLVHSRNHHGRIACIFPRGVDACRKPRTVGQSLGYQQSTLGRCGAPDSTWLDLVEDFFCFERTLRPRPESASQPRSLR